MRRKTHLLALLAVGAIMASAAYWSVAEEPTSRPALPRDVPPVPDDDMDVPPPPPGDDPNGGERPRPSRMRLNEKQKAEALAFLKKHRPEHYQQIIAMKESNSRRYERVLQMVYGFYQQFQNMPKAVQAQYLAAREARVKIAILRRKIQEASDGKTKAELIEQLKVAVGKQLDAEHAIREYRLVEMEKQLQRLREELKQRKAQRAELIAKRVEWYLKGGDDRDDEGHGRPGHGRRPPGRQHEPTSRPTK